MDVDMHLDRIRQEYLSADLTLNQNSPPIHILSPAWFKALCWRGDLLIGDALVIILKILSLVFLQVAHIIPPALGWGKTIGADSVKARLNVLIILEMFIPDTLEAYHGSAAMDSAGNAISLDAGIHEMFKGLRIYFEPRRGT
ncbi:hypothetical protein AJ79_07636 [Helicocarpus griseus UAMH5409]|uniref:Uncharacterized protein n=1 Tax=Helicocarpus griseus UAMH5409 TaxID=1447875 RepID=A0A2B7WSN4_9EURO|nr:hypothetical protein AJ79_07636 [Helicocarpus griseus UAMH5409]